MSNRDLLPNLDQETSPLFKEKSFQISELDRLSRTTITIEQLSMGFSSLNHSLTSIFDKLNVGVILLDESNRIEFCNKSAIRMGKESDVFQISTENKLRFSSAEIGKQFIRELGSIKDQANSKTAAQHSNDYKFEHYFGQLSFEIVPLMTQQIAECPGYQGVAIYIIDSKPQQPLSIDFFARHYQLTQAEKDIIHLLVNGLTVKKISEKRKTALKTVKSQLKNIFLKTGAHTQLELLNKILATSFPIDTTE